MPRTVYIFILITLSLGAFGQDMAPDTILTLRDVTVSAVRIQRFATGQVSLEADSLYRSQLPAGTLSELLPSLSPVFVRNYGPGTLSTLSFRGTSANHASLYWNGIRLVQPNIGYLDLSLVQNVFFNDISLLLGGSAPMHGSGAIGGSLHLENRPAFYQDPLNLEIGLTAGSFQTMATEGKCQVSSGRIFSRTAFSLYDAENNFAYQDDAGDTKKLPNAAITRGGFIQDLAVILPGDQYIMASAWFQYADRQIPPTLTSASSGASQIDRSWRAMVSWKDVNPRNSLDGRVAFFNEFTRYKDSLTSIYSVIQTRTATVNAEGTWLLAENSMIFSGLQYTYEYADLDYYNEPEDQQSLAVFASFRQDIPSIRWKISLNARQEFMTGFKAPFLFSMGMDGKIWRQFSGRLHLSRNFRAPSLNERFWVPGGNPELNPEKSWNMEAGLGWDNKWENGDLQVRVTYYNSWISNWILWLPGNSFWSVENAQKVWSRGAEMFVSLERSFQPLLIRLTGSYTYSRSTNEKQLFEYDASFHKQLIYTPLHRASLISGLEYRYFGLSIRGNYTGMTYTTRDNLASLPGYFILDAALSRSFRFRQNNSLVALLNLNNILNKDYQVTPERPMPGFNFMVTLRLSIRNNQNENMAEKIN